MSAATSTHDLDLARIEALLGRLEAREGEACTVPGCRHLDHALQDDAAALHLAA